jgi:hypothetical protein
MKKLSLVVSLMVLAAGFLTARAADKSNANVGVSTCPVASPDSKIEKQVDAAKIDYSLNPAGFREKLIPGLVGAFGKDNLDKIGYFVYTILPDSIPQLTDPVEVLNTKEPKEQFTLNGGYDMMNPTLSKKFGGYFFQATARNPQLVGLIQQIKGNFKPEDMGTAFPNKFVDLNDGRTIVLMSGCTPHDCGGTENLAAYDLAGEKAYLLVENSDSTKAYVFGSPDPAIRNLLLYQYLYH